MQFTDRDLEKISAALRVEIPAATGLVEGSVDFPPVLQFGPPSIGLQVELHTTSGSGGYTGPMVTCKLSSGPMMPDEFAFLPEQGVPAYAQKVRGWLLDVSQEYRDYVASRPPLAGFPPARE